MTIVSRLRDLAQNCPSRVAYRFHGAAADDVATMTFGQLHRAATAVASAVASRTNRADRVLVVAPSGTRLPRRSLWMHDCGSARGPPVSSTAPRVDQRFLCASGDRRRRLRAITRVDDGGDVQPVLQILAGRRAWLACPGSASMNCRKATKNSCRWAAAGRCGSRFPAIHIGFDECPSRRDRRPRQPLANLALCARAFRVDTDTRLCGWLPLFHDMGLIGLAFQTVHAGCSYDFMAPTTFKIRCAGWSC